MPNWKKLIVSGSDATLNSINVAINVVAQSFTGSLLGTSSYAVNTDFLDGKDSTVFATTGSNTFEGNQQVNGYLEVTDYISTNNVLYTNAIEENLTNGGITFVAGGFGFAFNNDVEVTGSIIATNFTGSLFGTASFAVSSSHAIFADTASLTTSASFAATASYVNQLNQNVSISGSLNVSQSITADSLTVNNFSVTDTLGIGDQIFYAQGEDGFSVNEDFNVGGPNQTAYHFTSGDVNRTSVVFSLARTTQFTNMFGVTGSNTNNKFVFGSEFANTDFEWRSGLGVSPVNLQGGNLLASLSRNGLFYAPSISGSFTGSLVGTASFATTASYANQALSSSYAVTASYVIGAVNAFPFTGSAEITGSLQVIGPTNLNGSLTASGLIYPTADGLVNQSIVTDGAGNLSFGNPYSNNTIVYGKNLSGGTIAKGTPLYFTGSGTGGNLVGVYPADAGNPARMPAGGIAGEQMLDEAEGVVLLDGFINGVNTSAFNSGDLVYVGVGGGYTNIRPTGSTNLVQPLGYVEKVSISNGSGVIKGPGTSNNLPNIQQGYFWTGNTSEVPIAIATSSIQNVVSSSFATTASYATYALFAANSGGGSIDTGSLLTTGSVVGNVLTFTKGDSTTFSLTVATGSSGGGGGSAIHTQAVAANTWSFTHNLNTLTPLLQVYDTTYEQIIPNEIVSIDAFTSEIRFDYSQAGYAVASTGGGLIITGSTPRIVQSIPAVTWSFNHNLGTKYPGFEVFNTNDDVIIPAGIHSVDAFNAEIYFATPTAGTAIANFSGVDGFPDTSLSASYAATASYSSQFYIGSTQTRSNVVASTISGSNIVFTLPTASYTSAFFKYTVGKTTNARSGEVMAVWNGSTVAFTDNSTADIGSTAGVTPTVTLSGGNVRFNMDTSTSGWRVKSIATFM